MTEKFETNKIIYSIVVDELKVDRFGGINLPIKGADLFCRGFDYIDIAKVTINDKLVLEMPIVKDYNYVDSGFCAITCYEPSSNICLMTCTGQFAILHHLADNSKQLMSNNTFYTIVKINQKNY